MNSNQKWLITIFLLLVFLSLTVLAHSKNKINPLITNAEIQQAIIQALGEPDFVNVPDRKVRFVVRYADLNHDRKLELIVWAGCCGYGGTGGYHLLIFTYENSTLNLLSDIAHVWTPLIVQKAKGNGWHDIVFQQGGGGAEFEYVVSRYSGKGYQNDNLPSIRPRQINGKWLVGKQRLMTIIGPRPLIR